MELSLIEAVRKTKARLKLRNRVIPEKRPKMRSELRMLLRKESIF